MSDRKCPGYPLLLGHLVLHTGRAFLDKEIGYPLALLLSNMPGIDREIQKKAFMNSCRFHCGHWGAIAKVFVEVRYFRGFASNTDTTLVPITLGIRW